MPVTITFDKRINVNKLISELAQAGFYRISSRSDEFIRVEDSNDEAAVMSVYEAHNAGPTAAEIQSALADAVQAHLDATVGERGYGSLLAAVSYLDSGVPQWAAEAAACKAWRDAVWVACYAIIAEIQAGYRSIPTAEELIVELPKIDW